MHIDKCIYNSRGKAIDFFGFTFCGEIRGFFKVYNNAEDS